MKYRHYFPESISAPQLNRPITVIQIGAGGTGSHIVASLAKLNRSLTADNHPGINLTLVDSDTISEANIGRTSIFSISDKGHNKAVVAITRVNTFYGTRWHAYPYKLTTDTRGLHEAQFIITAVDNVKTREIIPKLAHHSYWIDTGNGKSFGQTIIGCLGAVGASQPGKIANTVKRLPHILDLYPDMAKYENKEDQGPSCSLAEAVQRQSLFINQEVATQTLNILEKIFRQGYLEHHGAYIDSNSGVSYLPVDPVLWASMGYNKKKKVSKKAA